MRSATPRHSRVSALLGEDMISRSMRGLLEKNPDMRYQVVKNQEPRVNAYDRSIDELCVQTIAQYEPVARDLRLVIMIIKMNKDLERMADHAVNISESGLYLIANPFLGLMMICVPWVKVRWP